MSVSVIKNKYYQNYLIACFEHNDVMFKAHKSSVYPECVNDRGEKTGNTPHIHLAPYTDEETGKNYLNIIAEGDYVHSCRNIALFKTISLNSDAFSAQDILEAVEPYKSDAVAFLKTLDSSLEQIRKIDGDLYCSTRTEYEQLCNKYSVAPYPDSQITTELTARLSTHYPDNDVATIILNKLTRRRLEGIQNEIILANPEHVFQSGSCYDTTLETVPDDALAFIFKWFGYPPADPEAVSKAPDFVKAAKTNWGSEGIYIDEDQSIRFICDGNYGAPVVATIDKLPELIKWLDTYFVESQGIQYGDNWRINRGAYSRFVYSLESVNQKQLQQQQAHARLWGTFDAHFDNKDSLS